MKNKKRKFALLLAIMLAAGSVSTFPVQAGTMTTTIGEESYIEEIDNTVWNNPDGDVTVESGKVVFANESTDTTRLISKASVVRSEQLSELLDAEFTMNFSSLPEGKEFIFAMGLSSIESLPGEQGNLEIAFANHGGLTVQVKEYSDGDTPNVLIQQANCGSIDQVNVSVMYSNAGVLTLKVNGSVIGECKPSANGEGSVGFLQTGNCGVQISDMKVSMYKYDRPENSNIFEDFESGDFNLSLFSSKMTYAIPEYYPSTMRIEDYNGSKVLMFRNVGSGYLVTKQQYSNFELTFDLPYIQVEEEKDKDGNMVTPVCDSFGVSFGGGTGGDDAVVGFDEASDLLLFMNNGVMGYKTDHPMTDAKIHLYRESDGKVPVFRVSVIDGVVTVAVKWKDEDDSAYETMLTYTMSSGTRTGYVAIWAPSGRSSTFAIDNVSLKNLDKDANLIEVERTSSKVEVPADYNYEPQKKVYRETETEKEEMPIAYLLLAGIAGACVLAIGITVGVTASKNQKKKRGAENEKEV